METVKSADGTVIAYDRAGAGPPLIVSVGAFCTRRTFVPPEDLRQRFTVVTYDRRGRGDSGDTEPFAPEREYEDLAAVAAAVGPEPPFLFGHSSGAAIASRCCIAAAMSWRKFRLAWNTSIPMHFRKTPCAPPWRAALSI